MGAPNGGESGEVPLAAPRWIPEADSRPGQVVPVEPLPDALPEPRPEAEFDPMPDPLRWEADSVFELEQEAAHGEERLAAAEAQMQVEPMVTEMAAGEPEADAEPERAESAGAAVAPPLEAEAETVTEAAPDLSVAAELTVPAASETLIEAAPEPVLAAQVPPTPHPAPQDIWDASTRELVGGVGRLAVRGCAGCGLSLSVSARFCRRCGAAQQRTA